MKKIIKLLVVGLMISAITVLPSISASAKVTAYLIKDKTTSVVYQYDKKVLEEALLSYRLSGSDALYEEFCTKLSKHGFYSFYDDTKKYVDYDSIIKAFMDSMNNNKQFILDNFTQSSEGTTVKDIPSSITSVTCVNGQVKYDNKIVEDNDFGVVSIE